MTRKQRILTRCAVTSEAASRESLVEPLRVFGQCSSGMVTPDHLMSVFLLRGRVEIVSVCPFGR